MNNYEYMESMELFIYLTLILVASYYMVVFYFCKETKDYEEEYRWFGLSKETKKLLKRLEDDKK